MEARAAGHLKNGPRAHGYPDGSGTPREPGREVVLVNGADFSLGSSARKFRKICNMPWQTGGLIFANLILVEINYVCTHRCEAAFLSLNDRLAILKMQNY